MRTLWMLVAALCLSRVQMQLTSPGGSCCGVNLMDSSDRVVIEEKPLDLGPDPVTFKAVRVHLCCITRTYIQIWRRVVSGGQQFRRYELVWQMPVQATVYMVTSVKYTIFEIPNGVTLTSQSGQQEFHLGFWSPGSDKHCIPYKFLENSRMLNPSLERYSSEQDFTVGGFVLMDELPFPRTFINSMQFCEDKTCNDIIDSDNPFYDHAVAGPVGPPGPPGPPGSGDIVFPGGPGCDIGELVNDDISAIKKQNEDIQEQITDMNSIMKELTNGNIVTGTCKPGGFPGSYGIGYCYFLIHGPKMTYGEAMLTCRDRFQATLADIETDTEEVYIKRLIMKEIGTSANPQVEQYFLSAMWSIKNQQWYWYDEFSRTRKALLYSNWEPGHTIDELNREDTNCVVLEIDFLNDVSRWKPVVCEEKHYFICKMPKKCM